MNNYPNLRQAYTIPGYKIYNIHNINNMQNISNTNNIQNVYNIPYAPIVQPAPNISNINVNNQPYKIVSIKNSLHVLEQLNQTLNQSVSQSVFDLVNCAICLSPAEEPMSCPKCNNFCCKKCFKKYFEGNTTKKCPLCKRDITFNELNKNTIIQEIENIINKNGNNLKKIEELSRLLNTKKNEWEKQSNFISYILQKVHKYQQTLNNYKNIYIAFLSGCQKLIEKKFNDFQKKTEELVKNLVLCSDETKKSIIKFNTIIKNNQNNIYNSKNIKQLINEILDMERKYFNKKTKEETKSFLNSDIILEPQIIRREFSHTLKEGYQEIINDRDALIGDLIGSCDIKKSSQKYIITCKFKINLNESHNNICILVNQKIKEGDEPKDIFSLKLIKHDNNTLEFERQIETNNINFNTKNERLIETEILIFDVEPWEEEELGGEAAEEQCV